MKKIFTYLLLVLSIPSVALDGRSIIKELKKCNFSMDKKAIIVGVGKKDYNEEINNLKEICRFLSEKKVVNVVFVTDEIENLGRCIKQDFGIILDKEISIIKNKKLYALLSEDFKSCVYLDDEKVEVGDLNLFLNRTKHFRETYNLGISNVLDISKDSFESWITLFGNKTILLWDYPEQHVVLLDMETGIERASILAQGIQLPDSVKLFLCGNKANFEMSNHMEKERKYKLIGLNEVNISAVAFEGDDVHLYIEYIYFKADADTSIGKNKMVVVCDDKLQIKDYILLNFNAKVAKNHFAALLFTAQLMTSNELFTYNQAVHNAQFKYAFTKFEKKGNQVLEKGKKLYYISETISKKDIKGDVDLTCNFDIWNGMPYAYHSHYPLVYLFDKDKIIEVKLEHEKFPSNTPLLINKKYFSVNLKKTEYGYFLNSTDNSNNNIVSYHSETGKKIGEYKLPKKPIIDVFNEKTIDSFWTFTYNKSSKKTYVIKMVVW